MRLFIAEKYEQGKAIAEGLIDNPVEDAGFFRCGPHDAVVWAQGHLYELAEPQVYDPRFEHWTLEDLPIVPNPWKIVPIKKRLGQIQLINRLLGQATEIVHACDFDREGQLIGDEIIENAPVLRPGVVVQRLNASDDLSKKGVRAALTRMQPNATFTPMGVAALTRSKADWMFGISMSRAHTIEARRAGYGERDTMATGRVQTPTLAMIVRRDNEIERFEPTTFYVVAAKMEHRLGDLIMTWDPAEGSLDVDDEGRVTERASAERICATIAEATGHISRYSQKIVPEAPPLPHRMTSLVAAASASHGLTALQVKVAAQALYERYKVISYPRSDCRYLPLGQHEDALGVLHAIARNDPEKSILCGNADPAILSEAWDTARLSAHSHHAIIPVANTVNFANASHEERVVYDLICRSYIAQFYPHAEHLQTKVEALVLGHRFSLSQRETVTPGWRTLYPPKVAREKQRIPSLIEGDELRCTATQIDERTTKPKERFTDGTLMLAMEDAGRHVGDDTDEGRVSIGTEATRTDTIEGLFDHRFIMRKGRYIESTELGRDLIRDVQDEIKGVRMTAAFERVLDKIAEGKASPEAFLDRMRSLIIELLANVSIKDRKLARASTENGGDAFRKLAVTKPERKAKAKKRKRFAA